MKPKFAFVLSLPVILVGIPARAHIPFIEPEAREAEPSSLSQSERAEKDYSFFNPFPLRDDRDFQDAYNFAFDGVDSMAINAFLVPGDVDVYRVVPAQNDGFIFPAILASVLPPACEELIDFYPVVALVGPGLPRDPAVLALLPFDIDDEDQVPQPASGKNGVLYAPSPKTERRELFVEDVVTGLSWFLPVGLTQECLEPPGNPFLDCETFENSIVATAQDGMVVGQPYYVAIWDPEGNARDYTMNLGVTDAHYVDRPEINSEIECFKLIHGRCSQPYPDEPAPDGYFSPLCEAQADGPHAGSADAGPVPGRPPEADGSSSPAAPQNGGSDETAQRSSSGCNVSSSSTSTPILPTILLSLWLLRGMRPALLLRTKSLRPVPGAGPSRYRVSDNSHRMSRRHGLHHQAHTPLLQ